MFNQALRRLFCYASLLSRRARFRPDLEWLEIRLTPSASTVYVDDDWAGLANGTFLADADPVTPGDQNAVVGVNAFATVNGGLAAAQPGWLIVVNAGDYHTEAVNVATAGLTVRFQQGDSTVGSLANSVKATVELAGVTLTAGGDGTDTQFASTITGTGSLTKAGAGTMTLAGIDSYTGSTTVSAGTLQVSGSLGATAVTVADGASLAGTGSVGGSVTVQSGGTLTPGADGTGRLSVAADVGFDSGAVFHVELNGTAPAKQYDQLAVTGPGRSVNLKGAALDLSLGFTPASSDVGATFTLIDDAGAKSTPSGAFADLPEGTKFQLLDGIFQISYSGGKDHNDVVLTLVDVLVAKTSADLDPAGNLVLTSLDDVTDDELTIRSDSVHGVFVISDPNNLLVTGVKGATGDYTHSLTIPFVSVTGSQIFVNTLGGDDSLTVDLSMGDFNQTIVYDGGSQITGDSLTITGGTFASVTHTFIDNTSGTITAGANRISYTDLEPVFDNLDAADRVFTFSKAADVITLTDAGGNNLTIDSTVGESVTFANPTNSLTINAGGGDDVVNVASVNSKFGASLTINGDAGNDVVNLDAPITFAADNNLDVDLTDDGAAGDADQINVGAGAVLALSGSGAATLKASQSVSMAATSGITSADGNLTLEANQQSAPTAGNFVGIDLDGAALKTTGGGNVVVMGRGGDVATSNVGVRLRGAAVVESAGTGTITLDGTGGSGAGADNRGVELSKGGMISSTGSGAVSVVGTEGAGTASEGIALIGAGATVESTGGADLLLVADNVLLDTKNAVVDAGAGVVALRPRTPDTAIDLGGADAPGKLGLTDGELDRVSAGTIKIGDASSGPITVSDVIDRESATNLVLTTGDNNGLTFSDSTASLDSAGGDVTVSLNPGGTGAVTSGGAATDVFAGNLSVTAGTGGIGASGKPLAMSADTLTTLSKSDQFLSETDTVTVAAGDLNAGAGTITLVSGRFNTTQGGDILSPVVVGSGAVLGGSGSLRSATVNGTISPGASPGRLTSGPVDFQDNSTYDVQIAGTTAGSGYDQLVVKGTMTIGNNVTLKTTALDGFAPAGGDTFTIIDKGVDAVNGTFAGLPEGGVLVNFLGSGLNAFITYQGGTGNDVMLTVDRPPVVTGQGFSVAEGSAVGTSVGFVSASDSDGDPLTYLITGGNTGGAFAIDPATGEITVADPAALDFESGPTFSLTVRVDDVYQAFATATMTVKLTNVNPSAPSDADAAADSVAEGAANGTPVGITASSTDPNGPAVTYSLLDDAGGRFAIDPTTGVVTVANGGLLNGPAAYRITARASDGAGGTSTADFVINVTNLPPLVAHDVSPIVVTAGQAATNTGTWGDPGGDVVTLTASVGTVTKNANGTWTWSLATNAGTVSQDVTITAIDADGATASTTFRLTVVAALAAPVATPAAGPDSSVQALINQGQLGNNAVGADPFIFNVQSVTGAPDTVGNDLANRIGPNASAQQTSVLARNSGGNGIDGTTAGLAAARASTDTDSSRVGKAGEGGGPDLRDRDVTAAYRAQLQRFNSEWREGASGKKLTRDWAASFGAADQNVSEGDAEKSARDHILAALGARLWSPTALTGVLIPDPDDGDNGMRWADEGDPNADPFTLVALWFVLTTAANQIMVITGTESAVR